ncbi:hypothetical protein FHT44_005167 [Mycolicibacterium sp. BK634]|nr:hypothetical protein [Mycolicibacterium sp. BK634]
MHDFNAGQNDRCSCGHPERAWIHPHAFRQARDNDRCTCGLPVDAACHTSRWKQVATEGMLFGYSKTMDRRYAEQGITVLHEPPRSLVERL